MPKENKSSSPKQACVDCHFFSYAMKYYNSNQYSEEAVDGYYRNWIKEKCYNYNQSAEVPDECDYSKGYNNEKAPDRYVVGLKCYKNVWPVIELSMKKIPRTPDIKTCSFLHTVPKYREKAFEEMSAVERKDRCFFYKYVPGMHLETAEKLEGKESAQIKEVEPEDKQQSWGYKFHLSGDTWILSYEGKTIYLQDSKGLKHIHYLLNNPKKEIDALMLQREIYKIQPSKYKNRSEGTFIEEGMKISRIGNTKTRMARIKKKDELDYLIKQSEMQAENESKLINEERAKLQKELKDLEDIKEIKEEEGHLDETIVEEIASVKEEIFRLTKILANYGKGEIADIERARSAVKNTINNSLGKIKESHSSLWEHLDSSIQRRTFCSYTPAKHISWVLSP